MDNQNLQHIQVYSWEENLSSLVDMSIDIVLHSSSVDCCWVHMDLERKDLLPQYQVQLL